MSGSSSTALCARNAHITLYDITTWSWVNLVNPLPLVTCALGCGYVKIKSHALIALRLLIMSFPTKIVTSSLSYCLILLVKCSFHVKIKMPVETPACEAQGVYCFQVAL